MKLYESQRDHVHLCVTEPALLDAFPDAHWFDAHDAWLGPVDADGSRRCSLEGRYTLEFRQQSRLLWRGLERMEVWQRFRRQAQLYGAGLPVKRPLGLRLQQRGLLASAQWLVYALAETESLEQRLRQSALAEPLWQQLGALLRQVHDVGLRLPQISLSAFEINTVHKLFLADLESARALKRGQEVHKHRDLEALLASLLAARKAHEPFHFNDADWLVLTRAYIARARPSAD